MVSSLAVRHDAQERTFPQLLKAWRQKRRLSQLDLALMAGVSQRHISFLESGRTGPSRDMILRISESMEVPLRDRNAWLLAAGFAPVYKTRPLEDPQMSQVMAAVRVMLANHQPFPAVAIDRAWNIRLANAPFERLAAMLGAGMWRNIGGGRRNLMRLFFHPEGIRPLVTNWQAVAPLLWCRAQREAEAADGEDMRKVLDELRPHQDASLLWTPDDTPLLPLLPLTMSLKGMRISLFTVIATFGTAQDVTAEELRIESFFPADEVTERLFRHAAEDGSAQQESAQN